MLAFLLLCRECRTLNIASTRDKEVLEKDILVSQCSKCGQELTLELTGTKSILKTLEEINLLKSAPTGGVM